MRFQCNVTVARNQSDTLTVGFGAIQSFTHNPKDSGVFYFSLSDVLIVICGSWIYNNSQREDNAVVCSLSKQHLK